MDRRKRRAVSPILETVERRELLSAMAAVVAQASAQPAALAQTASATSTGVSQGSTAPIIPGQGTPTRQELARERFSAGFSGPISYGPGRFSDQAQITYIRGGGRSNQFLHGDPQMAIVTPQNRSAPITGEAYLQDKNTNSGGILALQLVSDGQSFDRQGRPTRFTFTADPNIYSGIYFNTTSSGTAKVTYRGTTASVAFQGLVYTNGLTNPLRNSDLVGRGGRTFRRS